MNLRVKIFIQGFLLLFIWSTSLYAKPRIPGLLQIPTADVIPHGLFNVSSRMNLFTVIDKDSVEELKYPVTGGVILGLSNRAQLGVQYGNEASVSFKTYIYEASGTDFFPDVVVGARSLFGSPEAWLHGVSELDTTRGLRNEAYIAFGSNVTENTRIHLGASSMPGANDQFAEGFAGVEQFFGSGIYLGYEFFQRFDGLHHNVSVVYKFKSYFSLSLGLSEFQSWIVQDGEWGFYPESKDPEFIGYDVPGINIAVSLGGWAMKGNRKTVDDRFKELKDKQREQKKEILALKEQLNIVQKTQSEATSGNSSTYKVKNNHLIDLLDLIKHKINSDVPYDPKEISELRLKILKMGRQAKNTLGKIVTNPTTDVNYRVQSCIIMGMSNDQAYTEPLLKATADPEPRVRREAILSLGKMKLQVALEFAQTLLGDPDESVSMAAKVAIRMIKEATGQKLEEAKNPETP